MVTDKRQNSNFFKIDTALSVAAELEKDDLLIWIDSSLPILKAEALGLQTDGETNTPLAISLRKAAKHHNENLLFARPNTVLLAPQNGLTPRFVDFVDNRLRDWELGKSNIFEELFETPLEEVK